MAIDESHEQNNACVKGDGGAVGLTENPSALLRWMVSGPEMARIIGEFRTVLDKKETVSQLHHHEDQPGDLIELINFFPNIFTVFGYLQSVVTAEIQETKNSF